MRSNQRWMKLRTTVQLSGALTASSKSKPVLKREDSFMKRFSTRQIVEAQDTVEGNTGSTSETDGERARFDRGKRRIGRLPHSVINPDSNTYFFWLMLVALCVLYNLWTPIVRQALPELQSRYVTLWIVLDVLADMVYLCDIGLQLRTGYLEQGIMVYESAKLTRHYLSSRPFLLDLAAVVPLDWLQLALGAWPILRFPRFVKLYRIRRFYYMTESRTVYPNVWRVANLVHVLLLLAHWFGCFYFLLSKAENFRGRWAYPYAQHRDFTTLTRMYLASVYWSTLTLTTIGDLPTPETNYHTDISNGVAHGNLSFTYYDRHNMLSRLTHLSSDKEYLFTIVSYLIGVFIFATIVGQVGNVITNRNANRLEFERLLDSAKLYMRHHRVPRSMQRRVQRWYDYSWSRGHIQGGGDINTALRLLPDKLRTELALHVNLLTLKKVSIFQACQPEFLHDLVLKMKAYIFTPGDLICRKGEIAREMFIIADGILEVISENGKVLTTMRAGDFFGEIGILNLDGLNKRTADVRSVGYAELFSLSRENVLSAMRDYPEAQDILQKMGRKRLMEAKRASEAAKNKRTARAVKMDDMRTRDEVTDRAPAEVQESGAGTGSEKESTVGTFSDQCLPLIKRLRLLKNHELSASGRNGDTDNNQRSSATFLTAASMSGPPGDTHQTTQTASVAAKHCVDTSSARQVRNGDRPLATSLDNVSAQTVEVSTQTKHVQWSLRNMGKSPSCDNKSDTLPSQLYPMRNRTLTAQRTDDTSTRRPVLSTMKAVEEYDDPGRTCALSNTGAKFSARSENVAVDRTDNGFGEWSSATGVVCRPNPANSSPMSRLVVEHSSPLPRIPPPPVPTFLLSVAHSQTDNHTSSSLATSEGVAATSGQHTSATTTASVFLPPPPPLPQPAEAGAAAATAAASPSGSPIASASGQLLPDVTFHEPIAVPDHWLTISSEINSLLHTKLGEIHASLTARIDSLQSHIEARDRSLQSLYFGAQNRASKAGDVLRRSSDFSGCVPMDSGSLERRMLRAEKPPMLAATRSHMACFSASNDWEVQMLAEEMAQAEVADETCKLP